MLNERVELTVNDLPHGQLAPSQASRVSWYPGKTSAIAGDATWDKHFRVPVGNPAIEPSGPAVIDRVIVLKTDRGVICDQVLSSTFKPGTDGRFEKNSGYNALAV
jgi:hypothetical protein